MQVISMERFEATRALREVNRFMASKGMLDIISMSGYIRPIPFIYQGNYYWIDENNEPHKGKPEKKRIKPC